MTSDLLKQQNLATIVLTTLLLTLSSNSLPLDSKLSNDINEQYLEGSGGNANAEKSNKTQQLYVVKAVVYEVGILTDVDENDTTSSEETHERIDLTFFDAHRNDSHIDLGNIPLPVQTNISGQVLTGIAPFNIGAFSHPAQLLNTLPLTGTIVNITHSDTAYFKFSTHNTTLDNSDVSAIVPESFLRIPKPIENLNDD